MSHLLLVDDDTEARRDAAARLRAEGHDVSETAGVQRAHDLLAAFAFEAVLVRLRLVEGDGLSIVEAATARHASIPVVALADDAAGDDARLARAAGALSVVTPHTPIEELLQVLHGTFERRQLQRENARLRQTLDDRFGPAGLVGRSDPMRALLARLEPIAASAAPVLLHGEIGTGKQTVARALHHASSRRARRFVAVNCHALPEALLDAELFGDGRGSDGSGGATRQARVEHAAHGTLLLNDVGTLPLGLQSRLLRLLQDGVIDRPGDHAPIAIDVRVIAASAVDLGALVSRGSFLAAVYERLRPLRLSLPPLRERREDIPLLVQHFLHTFATAAAPAGRDSTVSRESRSPNATTNVGRLPKLTVSTDALACLLAHPWPGNVRQLENVIERAVALLGGRTLIEAGDLPAEVQGAPASAGTALELPPAGIDLPATVERVERELIARALARTGGNRTAAATLLNIKRTTLVEKLRRLAMSGQ